MTVFDYLLLYSLYLIVTCLALLMLTMAWETFEGTQLGQMILDKFKRKEK